MADTPVTWPTCIIRPERWNGRSRFQHLPRKMSGRSTCRERIGRVADTLWLCAASQPQGKARKLVGPHLNCKFRNDLKRKDLTTWRQCRNHLRSRSPSWNAITCFMPRPTYLVATWKTQSSNQSDANATV